MPKPESGYPADWFTIGERELRRARRFLEDKDYPGAGFNLQQAAEKYLKGYLLARGWKLRRVHDLEVLLNEASRHDAAFAEFRDPCRKITQYYLEDRYPFIVASELTSQDIRESLAVAERLIALVKSSAGA
jgi:HEPN domain-containing protein